MVSEKPQIAKNPLTAEDAECPICGSGRLISNVRYDNPYWPDLQYFNDLQIIGCQACGFGYSWPEISDQTINEFYKSEYRRDGSVFHIDYDGLRIKPVQQDKRALAQLLLAKQYVEFNEGDLFLELGPGGGGAFNVAEKVLTNPKIIGIELNDGAAKAFKRVYGADIYSSVQDVIANGYLGKICLFSHSLEHFKLSWLQTVLQDLKNLVAPGGVLVIEVPLVDMRKHRDLGCGEAPHFLFFSLDSIRLLFERNGWIVLYLDSCSSYYEEWRKLDVAVGSKKIFSVKSKLKAAGKRVLSLLPRFVQNGIVKIFISRFMDFSNQEFNYGGDRTCLRLVVRPALNHMNNR